MDNKKELLPRIAVIYNSMPPGDRIKVHRHNTWLELLPEERETFDIPEFSADDYRPDKKSDRTLRKHIKSLNPRCVELGNDLQARLRNREKTSIGTRKQSA